MQALSKFLGKAIKQLSITIAWGEWDGERELRE